MTEKKKTAYRKALTDAVLSRYKDTLARDTVPVQFSTQYSADIARLTKRTQRKSWKYVNTTAKRILIAAILVFLLAATVCAAVPAIREGLLRFFLHDNGVAFTFEFPQEDVDKAPKEIEQYYAPAYIPDEFSLVDESYRKKFANKTYCNDNRLLQEPHPEMNLFDTTLMIINLGE